MCCKTFHSVSQCVAVCCSVLQYVAVCCTVLHCVIVFVTMCEHVWKVSVYVNTGLSVRERICYSVAKMSTHSSQGGHDVIRKSLSAKEPLISAKEPLILSQGGEEVNAFATVWGGCIGCLVFIGHFPQKSPVISGSFAERDLQVEASYALLPLCACFWCRRSQGVHWDCVCVVVHTNCTLQHAVCVSYRADFVCQRVRACVCVLCKLCARRVSTSI